MQSPILDIHAHIFPEKVAAKAVASIGSFYGLPMSSSEGTARELLAISQAAGVSRTVIFSTATRKEQADPINHFMIRQQRQTEAFLAFGTLHPDQNAIEINKSLKLIDEGGLHGIKLHPDFQKIEADAPFVQELCRQAGGRWPILFHAGDPRYDFSHPRRIARLAALFPETTLIAAHFGGWSQWAEAAEILPQFPNVLVDTSSSLCFLSPGDAVAMIGRYGVGRVLFGSDYPMWTPAEELGRLGQIGLSPGDLRAILWKNGARLLKLSNRLDDVQDLSLQP